MSLVLPSLLLKIVTRKRPVCALSKCADQTQKRQTYHTFLGLNIYMPLININAFEGRKISSTTPLTSRKSARNYRTTLLAKIQG